MGSFASEPPEVDLVDPPVAKRPGERRWTLGRITTDLAIVAVAVPIGLDFLVPPPRAGCGMTPQLYSLTLGSTLAFRRLSTIDRTVGVFTPRR